MDFRNRSGRPAQNVTQNVNSSGAQVHQDAGSRKSRHIKRLANPLSLLLLFCVAIVLLGVTGLAIVVKQPEEADHINEDNLQAVFLEGGQVYFGSISELNDNYLRLNNIYYLRVNQQVQPEQEGQPAQQDISLVKLGCELHGPEDLMILNRSKVLFWENLKEDGQVTQAVKKYIETNPDGQDCSTQADNGNNGAEAEAAEE